MNLAEITKLIKLVEASKIDEVEIQQDKFQIRLKKNSGNPLQVQTLAPVAPAAVVPPVETVAKPVPPATEDSTEDLVRICSPMVGSFYRAPSPEAAAYINIGDQIKPGQIICLVEAMKLMNEIEAEISGTITEILVENGQPVEYNQPLFLVRKL